MNHCLFTKKPNLLKRKNLRLTKSLFWIWVRSIARQGIIEICFRDDWLVDKHVLVLAQTKNAQIHKVHVFACNIWLLL